MKLSDLDAEFIRWEDRIEPQKKVAPGYDTSTPEGNSRWVADGYPCVEEVGPVTYIPRVDTFATAQGVEFDCPKCANGHRIEVAFADRGVLDQHGSRDKDGRPTRWQASGTGLNDLTLSPSVDCTKSDPNCWHGFITNGEAK